MNYATFSHVPNYKLVPKVHSYCISFLRSSRFLPISVRPSYNTEKSFALVSNKKYMLPKIPYAKKCCYIDIPWVVRKMMNNAHPDLDISKVQVTVFNIGIN
jgi:hypothetical protein